MNNTGTPSSQELCTGFLRYRGRWACSAQPLTCWCCNHIVQLSGWDTIHHAERSHDTL